MQSCTEAIPDVETEDELNLIVRGAYYGHPNRLRGQTDPRQCVWHSGTEASTSEYTAPMAILPASSDGIIEFQSDHFGKQMRGDLLIAKYKGGLYRVILTPDGTAVAEAPFLFDDGADLSIAQGPDGKCMKSACHWHFPAAHSTLDLSAGIQDHYIRSNPRLARFNISFPSSQHRLHLSSRASFRDEVDKQEVPRCAFSASALIAAKVRP
jgi:hypothetical protein